jgi:hypothetical protein
MLSAKPPWKNDDRLKAWTRYFVANLCIYKTKEAIKAKKIDFKNILTIGILVSMND